MGIRGVGGLLNLRTFRFGEEYRLSSNSIALNNDISLLSALMATLDSRCTCFKGFSYAYRPLASVEDMSPPTVKYEMGVCLI